MSLCIRQLKVTTVGIINTVNLDISLLPYSSQCCHHSHPEVDTGCFSCSSPDLNSSKWNPWLWKPQNYLSI